MQSITFTFNTNVPREQQELILEQINAWPEVRAARRLKPEAKRADILRMAYAYVNDGVDEESMKKRLMDLPEIESADIPPKRSLA